MHSMLSNSPLSKQHLSSYSHVGPPCCADEPQGKQEWWRLHPPRIACPMPALATQLM